ncbi:hypothetical protein KIK84_14795 [Curvibacter sp. CHRR-16]|uniref:hypothetical protein n=1 Tax=Curvibacter sp. CHRR-16 TaxID=2835872 RepID=UPI001BDA86ED|nr:hypothetical protein [Curvibacter sp. CHRR-16]MBT0571593.1 hypothetical protein [Curvibacter sp. CHRR-16]
MKTRFVCTLAAALVSLSLPSWSQAQTAPDAPSSPKVNFDKAIQNGDKDNWYFSWGYSRQQYAPSDIHVSQPGLGNDFTVHQAQATDFPANFGDTIKSLFSLDFTTPQNNARLGKFMNAEKTFAIELNIDHTKYNTTIGQTARVSGTQNNQPLTGGDQVLTDQYFDYELHNGLNHIMLNAVWFTHLYGPQHQPGELQLVSRVGAGILLPHADNVILGNRNEVGPKNENICCFKSNDWWQLNGWTAGVEVGFRYTFYKTWYAELTQKFAYGRLSKVPVYQGSADQTIWMSEQILSAGFLF